VWPCHFSKRPVLATKGRFQMEQREFRLVKWFGNIYKKWVCLVKQRKLLFSYCKHTHEK
jgi:hypothetical protein